jgi:hypothetical protein
MVVVEKRTQDQILSQAPIKVKLGDVEYDLKPLRILKARSWRQELITKMNAVTTNLRQETGSDAAFMSGLGYTLLQFPDILMELVLSYAPDTLSKEKVEAEATEEQIAIAFGSIMQVAFPFQGELKAVMQVLGASATSQQ